MKNLAILFFLLFFALTALGQPPKPTPRKSPKTAKTPAVKLGAESEEFEKARNLTAPAERIAALRNFIKNFPASTEIPAAQLLVVTAQVELGVVKFQANDLPAGLEFYKSAVQEAPVPVSDEVFSKVLIGLPVSLYAINQRAAAFDIAKLIEEKIGDNVSQQLGLAKFYLNVEYGTEAIRLAQKAIALAPDSAAGHQLLAAAYRLNFRLDDAAAAYARTLELGGESVPNRLGLAEMKRALGKSDEALAIYREILADDAANKPAQAGLTLALFDAGKRAEAETELRKALEADPENARLMSGAAYWYAARGFHEPAVEYARKAIAAEPRNVWSYVAQARALIAQNKPLEAEKILLAARQYSDFPTLDYELAAARLAAGLYREAAETLKRSFAVNKDGLVETYLGNRILADASNFTELLSLERRTAIFEMNAADTEENTSQLKSLLEFNQKLEAKETTEEELAGAAENFVRGGDNMRLHRQLFAASRLLEKKTALPKVLELMQSAIGGVDSALNVPAPAAAVLADQIYGDRQFAMSQNLVVVVPDLPRATLSAILRGQIEDLAGRAYFQQNNVGQSIVRLKRALSVLPDKSAWSRASQWHLGEAFQADGKEKEALESYIKGYNKDLPDADKRVLIENLYVKVNGSADGLDERIGARPETTVAAAEKKPAPANTDNVRLSEPTPTPEVKTEPTPAETPQPAELKPAPTPESKPEETPAAPTETKTEPVKLPETVPAVTTEKPSEPTPTPEPTPEVAPVPTPTPITTPTPEEVRSAETKPEEVKTAPAPTPESIEPSKTPLTVEPTPTPATTPTPVETPIAETRPTPTPETTPEIKPEEIKPEEPRPAETKTEPTPTPQNASVVVTDNIPQFPPSPRVKEPKSQSRPNEIKPDRQPVEKTSQNSSKPLFDPVIINVGPTAAAKPENGETKPLEEKPLEEKPAAEKTIEVAQKIEPAPTPKPENNLPEKQTDDKVLTGELRPRIIITDTMGNKTVTEEIATCKLVINPDSLSLLNGGGSLGLTVGFDGDGDFRQIAGSSSSPEDLEVRYDSDIGANQRRAFFIVKSISTRTGVFTITFAAPCGKKEILVRVR